MSTEIVGNFIYFGVVRHEVARHDWGARRSAIHTVTTPTDWVSVVPFTDAGELVMIRLHRFGIDGPSLEIPGGMIDAGELAEDAARRELLEETGYAAREVRLVRTLSPNPALQATRLHVFEARGCVARASVALEELEDCEVVLVKPDSLRDRIAEGELHHGLVIAALALLGVLR